MTPKKAKRIYRELSEQEWQQVKKVRQQTEAELPELMEKGRLVFTAFEAAREVIAELKATRDQQGLSLADVMQRSGMSREAVSRLENDPEPNPTIRTLVRYATAVGVELKLATRLPARK